MMREHRNRHGRVMAVAYVLSMIAVGGCAKYRLQGVVVIGDAGAVLVVDHDDPRLDQIGLSGAVLDLTMDPNSLRPTSFGPSMTDERGRFDITIDQLGAGFLEYELGILCRLNGYRSLSQNLPMPSSRRWLLVMMTKGRDTHPVGQDVLQETLEWKDRLLE